MVNGINIKKVYTYEQIKDYMKCPLCYHIEHVESVGLNQDYYKDNRRVASDEAILEAITNYYFLHMDGRPPSLKQVYNKYYSELMRRTSDGENKNIVTETITNDSIRTITRNGYKWLRMFYEWNAEKPQAVIAVNHDFLIKYKELGVQSKFPLIREVEDEKGDRKLEVFIFGFSNKNSPEESLIRDTDTTLLLKGFIEAFGTTPDSLKVYSIDRGKEYEVYRTQSDLNKLEATFLGFIQSVSNVAPYQRIGAHEREGKFKKNCDTYFD